VKRQKHKKGKGIVTNLVIYPQKLMRTASINLLLFFFFDLYGVSGPVYAHHDYSPRPTGHPASPGVGKTPRG